MKSCSLDGYKTASFILLLIYTFYASSLYAAKPVHDSKDNTTALIIISTQTLGEMQTARTLITQKGIKIRSVLPPSSFIANVPKSLAAEINYFCGCPISTLL